MNHSNNTGSQLPPALEALIARVVKRARLRRGERRDVEAELRTHFAAGLAEGKATEELVRGFGDARAAGRMVGRAKRRCRGVVWQAFVWARRAVGALFALVLVTYAWAAWAYYGAEPTITKNYLKEINDPIRALDPAECALPEYEAVYYSFSRAERDRLGAALSASPGDMAWEDRAWAMAQMRPHLDRIRGASRLANMGYVLADHDGIGLDGPVFELARSEKVEQAENTNGMLNIRLPQAQLAGYFCAILTIDASDALATGDGVRFVEDARAILGIGRQLNQVPFTIVHQIGVYRASRLMDVLREALTRDSAFLSGEQLRTLAHELGAFRAGFARVPLDIEEKAMLDLVQRSYSRGPLGAAILNRHAFDLARLTSALAALEPGEVYSRREGDHEIFPLDPAIAVVSAGRLEADAFVRRFFECARADAERSSWTIDEFQTRAYVDGVERNGLASRRMWYMRTMVLAVGRIIANTWRFNAEVDATLGVLAAEVFRREHGRWPASWDELVPAYLPEVPIDYFDGKPLRIGERDGQWFIYSIGVDRKDDGGRVPIDALGVHQGTIGGVWASRADFDRKPEAERKALDGDWILWPPVDEKTGEFVVNRK